MSTLLPAALRPPDVARRLRMGRCAEGVALWLHPAADGSASQPLIAAWWDALRARAQARGYASAPICLLLTDEHELPAYAFRPAVAPAATPPHWAPDGRTRRCALDELPGVRAVPPAPPAARYDEDDDDDERDIFEDYAELSGMTRDEWMLSVV